MEVPESHQALLAIILNLLQRNLALNSGKAVTVAEMTENILFHLLWDKKYLQSLIGNTVWLSCLLPRVRAYMSPALEIISLISGKTGTLPKGH